MSWRTFEGVEYLGGNRWQAHHFEGTRLLMVEEGEGWVKMLIGKRGKDALWVEVPDDADQAEGAWECAYLALNEGA